jgi:LacI family transcriptional regulator
MQQAQMAVLDEYCRTGGATVEAGAAFGRALLHLSSPPTAVFCTNNKVLLGFMHAVAEANVLCPEEISIAGFDDFTWMENFHPPLTTVVQPARELGREAMRLLLSRIASTDAQNPEARQVKLKPELRVRESTARLRRVRTGRSALHV